MILYNEWFSQDYGKKQKTFQSRLYFHILYKKYTGFLQIQIYKAMPCLRNKYWGGGGTQREDEPYRIQMLLNESEEWFTLKGLGCCHSWPDTCTFDIKKNHTYNKKLHEYIHALKITTLIHLPMAMTV